MKWLAIVVISLLGLLAFALAHPYMNGVACTHQRECERAALLDVAYEVAKLRHDDGGGTNVSKTMRQILDDAPKPSDIDDSRFGVTMAWDIVERTAYQIGDVDKTILLFPDLVQSTIPDSLTPLIAHVSSSFTTKNHNCVLFMLPTAEIAHLGLTDDELRLLLECQTPEDATIWFKSR